MQAGTRLGPYEILEPLGAGGMGEVYLADDSRLGRKVAIKVLPVEFASDPERLARFEQEARAAAALNHPHIAVVHDIGTEDDTHFIVQEYLEGHALDTELLQGALTVKKAIAIGAEVAEALAAAHEAGIVHRDLKPANIFVTNQGHAKVLDFGLAKLVEGAEGKGDLSMSPTMLRTMAGQVMGTAGYMAPEQVEGKAVDHRADIFAFGCVLYESVVGAMAFAGQSVPDRLSKILHDEPPELVEVTDKMPAELARITRKCLAKEPESRYQHADDLVVDLRAAANPSGPATGLATAQHAAVPGGAAVAEPPAGTRAAAGRSGLSAAVPWVIAAIAIVVALASSALRSQESAATGIVRFSINRGQLEAQQYQAPPFAVSPDGQTIAYLAMGPEGEQLYRRRIDELEPTPIPDSVGARGPFFSPDGSQLAFFAEGELKRVAVAGGRPSAICAVSTTNGSGVWTEDDEIIFGLQAANAGLYRVPAAGGDPTTLTTLNEDRTETGHGNPQLLPDGNRVLFSAGMRAGELQMVRLDTGNVTLVNAQGGQYHAASGHLFFVDAQQLFAQPFDHEELTFTGNRVALLDGVINFNISPSGTLMYSDGMDPATGHPIVRIDPSGQMEELTSLPGSDYTVPTLSADGTILGFTEGSISADANTVGVYELDRGALNRRVAEGFGQQWRGDEHDRRITRWASARVLGDPSRNRSRHLDRRDRGWR